MYLTLPIIFDINFQRKNSIIKIITAAENTSNVIHRAQHYQRCTTKYLCKAKLGKTTAIRVLL